MPDRRDIDVAQVPIRAESTRSRAGDLSDSGLPGSVALTRDVSIADVKSSEALGAIPAGATGIRFGDVSGDR